MAPNMSHPMADAIAARLTQAPFRRSCRVRPAEVAAAAAFVAGVAQQRLPGEPSIALEPMSGDDTHRRMRLAIVNDDMPFLVDSIAAMVGADGIAIDRVIHPVLPVTRDAEGQLQESVPAESPILHLSGNGTCGCARPARSGR